MRRADVPTAPPPTVADLRRRVQQAVELLGDEVLWSRREVSREPVQARPALAAEIARECLTHIFRLLLQQLIEARDPDAHRREVTPPRAPILESVTIRDHVLQQVHALLARPPEFGVHQLGAVHEGLLAYTGRITDDGRFQLRLAGRDRETSAAYYTPEVLTRCLTRHTLTERLGEPGRPGALTADEILGLTICEPAIGSGAFLGEAVDQLARAYLERKQAELARTIPADDHPRELARVAYHFIRHRAYGVDSDALAAELGKASLRLGALPPNLDPPDLDLRIRVGDSLVGARRDVVLPDDLAARPAKPPLRVTPGQPRPPGGIYHFLLPDPGMAPYESDRVVAELCPRARDVLRAWRRSITRPFTAAEVRRLQQLSAAIDVLWSEHRRLRDAALARVHRPIQLWGQPPPSSLPDSVAPDLHARGAPGARLRAVMDFWCALWTWPVERAADLPARDAWIDHLESLLERGEPSPAPRFFHWELEFPEVFESPAGGFDIILGNPPWLKLSWEEGEILGDLDPSLAERRASDVAGRRADVMQDPRARAAYLDAFARAVGTQAFLHAPANYPLLSGVQTNLYKCFLALAMRLAAPDASVGFFHQKGVYDDPRGGLLREALHRRLRLRVHLINKLLLFPDVEDQKHYELTILRGRPGPIAYTSVSNVLHPAVLDGSFDHDGAGPVPEIKDAAGKWDLRPHRSRLVDVDEATLALFAALYDPPGTPPAQARLPLIHSREVLSALRRFADAPRRIDDLRDSLCFSEFFHETNQQKDGTLRRETHTPDSTRAWIVSGPHISVGTPFAKTPNAGCRHNQDYASIDLTAIPDAFLPRTNYAPDCPPAEYHARLPTWRGEPLTRHYRHVHRRMATPTGERTLISSVVPPGAAHINTLIGLAVARERDLLLIAGVSASLPADFFIRSIGKADIYPESFAQLPLPTRDDLIDVIVHRALALHCLTTDYADLWDHNLPRRLLPSASAADPRCAGWDHPPRAWTRDAALRTPYARRQALVELDVLYALSLRMTLAELLLIYRVQFPVLQQYERETHYDRRGKIIFTTHKALADVGLDRRRFQTIKDAREGDTLPAWAVDARGPYLPPFDRPDREADMAAAHAHFTASLGA